MNQEAFVAFFYNLQDWRENKRAYDSADKSSVGFWNLEYWKPVETSADLPLSENNASNVDTAKLRSLFSSVDADSGGFVDFQGDPT